MDLDLFSLLTSPILPIVVSEVRTHGNYPGYRYPPYLVLAEHRRRVAYHTDAALFAPRQRRVLSTGHAPLLLVYRRPYRFAPGIAAADQ